MTLEWAARPAKKVVDAFLLRGAEKVASSRSELQQENAARYHSAALRRMRGALELQQSDPVAALALYREAAVYCIVALVQGAEPERVALPADAAVAWEELDRRAAAVLPAELPVRWAAAREVLANADPLTPDGLTQDALAGSVSAVAETVGFLASIVEPRSPREIRVTRGVRIGSSIALVVFVVGLVVAQKLAPKNLALNKPVTTSSERPGSPAPAGADNGEIEKTYGVHTNVEQNPWVRIDLGASVPVHEVRVYNRGDGYESEILPLVLQLSDDDATYTDVAERNDLYTQEHPWVARIEGKRARYVRIYMPKQGYIALSEIEVY